MSLTPLDESDSKPREGGRPPGDGTDDSAGFLDRVRGVIGRVVAALSGGTDSRETTVAADERRDGASTVQRGHGDSGTALDARTAERSLTWAEDPEDDRPGGDDVDRPELVASWDDCGLTLSEPDGEESSISSDTWMDVER